jgi:hypothetical protein
VKLKDLSEVKRSHLAWRLDNKTTCGLIAACRIARLGTHFDDQEVYAIFRWAGLSERSAKIHAGKVERFDGQFNFKKRLRVNHEPRTS